MATSKVKTPEMVKLLKKAPELRARQAFLYELYKDARAEYDSVKSRLLEITYQKGKEDKK